MKPLVVAVLALVLARAGTPGACAADASPAPSASAAPAPSAAATSTEDPKMTALAASLVAQAQSGKIDRSLFDAKMQAGLSQTMLDTMSQQMGRLGTPEAVTFESFAVISGYRSYHYRIGWSSVAVDESFALDPDGKIAGWYFQPAA